MTETYDATKQHVSAEHIEAFLAEKDMWNLSVVPGIGDVSTKKLRESQIPDDLRITSAYGLLGIFLALATEGESMQQHCDKFMLYRKLHCSDSCHSCLS